MEISKIVSLNFLISKVLKNRKNKTVVLVTGCFDVLHPGHLNFLSAAKKQGDLLIVGLEPDSRIKKLKGSGRPFNLWKKRAENLAEPSSVDYIFPLPRQFDQTKDHFKLISLIKPTVLAVSENTPYIKKKIDLIKKCSGKIFIFPVYRQYSTTKIVSGHRKSVRLQNFDYSSKGLFFVTICTQDRKCLFGNIINNKIIINKLGKIINQCYLTILERFNNIKLDQYQIMPNHIHGIIVIDDKSVGVGFPDPQLIAFTKRNIWRKKRIGRGNRAPTLGQIVAYFKYKSTKQINGLQNTPGKRLWQRNYYEHIIRTENDLNKIRRYVMNNPKIWNRDRNNPQYLK